MCDKVVREKSLKPAPDVFFDAGGSRRSGKAEEEMGKECMRRLRILERCMVIYWHTERQSQSLPVGSQEEKNVQKGRAAWLVLR